MAAPRASHSPRWSCWAARYWPGVASAPSLANAATPVPLAAAIGIAAGNTLEALLAAALLRRVAGSRPQLEDPRQTRALILLAASRRGPSSRRWSASPRSLATGALGGWPPAQALASWWAGDASACWWWRRCCFSWSAQPRIRDTRRLLEVVALVVGTAAAADLGLLQRRRFAAAASRWSTPTSCSPSWSGRRCASGPRGASLITLVVAAVAVWHTARGGGPFLVASTGGTLFAVACYLLVLAVTGLVVASAVWSERDRATRALQQSEERLHLALDSARMGIWYWSVETNALTWDDNLRRIYGLEPDEAMASYEQFIARVHPDDREFVVADRSAARSSGRGARLRVPDPAARRPGSVDRGSGQGRPRCRRAGRGTSPACAWM